MDILNEKIQKVYDIGKTIFRIYIDMKIYMNDDEKDLFYKSCRKIDDIYEETMDNYYYDIEDVLKDSKPTDRMFSDFELLKDEFKKVITLGLEFHKIKDSISMDVYEQIYLNDMMNETVVNAVMPHHPGYCGMCDQVCCDGFCPVNKKKKAL